MKLLNALSILQNLYTGIIWVGNDLKIVWVNSQTEQLLSVSKSRLVGLSIIDILMPNQTDVLIKNETLQNPQTTTQASHENKASENQPHTAPTTHSQLLHDSEHYESDAKRKLKTQFHNANEYQQPFIEYGRYIYGVTYPLYAHYSVTPMEYEGKSYFLIEMWQGDRRSRLDKEQRLQEQHDVSREMLRSVAHEVKNPLAGIRGAAQLLIKQTRQSQETVENDLPYQQTPSTSDASVVYVDSKKLTTYANIVINESDRLTKLIEQLLGSNKLPELQLINIHEPLEHVLLLTQTQFPTVNIHRDYDLSLPELKADKNQLIQVFLNLVNNACQAMLEQDDSQLPDDYCPQLNLITRIEHQFTIGTVHHRQVIKVSVQDNGTGIAADLIERIFFPLVTGRANGTGLGLALVQEIVHRHEGAIEVNSQPRNTIFNIYLPLELTKSVAEN